MKCHACQTEVPLAAGESVGFRDECARCAADLHVCLNCTHHDPSAYNECRESSAERVADRDRANRCDYFRPAAGAFRPAAGAFRPAAGASRSAEGEVAPSGGGEKDAAKAALEDLFRKD